MLKVLLQLIILARAYFHRIALFMSLMLKWGILKKLADDLRKRLAARKRACTLSADKKVCIRMVKIDFLDAIAIGRSDIARDIYEEFMATSKDHPTIRYRFVSRVIGDTRKKPANSTIWVKPIPGLGMMTLAFVIKSNLPDLATILINSLEAADQARLLGQIRRLNPEITESQLAASGFKISPSQESNIVNLGGLS